MTTQELQNVTITSLDEGWKLISLINHGIRVALDRMAEAADDNQAWQKWSNEKYELKKAKRHVQGLMARIVAERHKNAKAN